MTKILTLLIISVVLAYLSEKNIFVVRCRGKRIDLALIALIIVLSLFCGLRTWYNDTGVYISEFRYSATVETFFKDPPGLLENTGFYLFNSVFRHHITDNYHVYFLVIAFFTVSLMVTFIRDYSESFTFSIFLYLVLGLYVSALAAMKQCIAIAILTIAIRKLIAKKYGSFYILVFIAMLFHAYAIMFIVAPIFVYKPWTPATYLSVFATLMVLFTFEDTIVTFLEVADTLGREIDKDVVFDTVGINLFRLAVFSVPFIFSFFCRHLINYRIERKQSFMVNMSSFSFLIMSLGIYSGANLFGRSANYFAIGVVIALPWMIKKSLARQSSKIILAIATMCYLVFFWYGNSDFDSIYRSITFVEFLTSLM